MMELLTKAPLILLLIIFSSCDSCNDKRFILPNNDRISQCETVREVSEKFGLAHIPFEGFKGQYSDDVLKKMILIPAENYYEDVFLSEGEVEELRSHQVERLTFQEIFHEQFTFDQIVDNLRERYSRIMNVKLKESPNSTGDDKVIQIVKSETEEVVAEIEFLSFHKSTIVSILPVK